MKKWFIVILIMAGIFLGIVIARAWTGDPANPHVLMGAKLMQTSQFNRIMK